MLALKVRSDAAARAESEAPSWEQLLVDGDMGWFQAASSNTSETLGANPLRRCAPHQVMADVLGIYRTVPTGRSATVLRTLANRLWP